MKKWLWWKSAWNITSVQANFVKTVVYLPLPTYYQSTNLQVVKTFVHVLHSCV